VSFTPRDTAIVPGAPRGCRHAERMKTTIQAGARSIPASRAGAAPIDDSPVSAPKAPPDPRRGPSSWSCQGSAERVSASPVQVSTLSRFSEQPGPAGGVITDVFHDDTFRRRRGHAGTSPPLNRNRPATIGHGYRPAPRRTPVSARPAICRRHPPGRVRARPRFTSPVLGEDPRGGKRHHAVKGPDPRVALATAGVVRVGEQRKHGDRNT
jgi:hypothetical protein